MLAVAASLPLRLRDVFLRGPVAPGYRATYASPLIIVFSQFGQHFSVDAIQTPCEKATVRADPADTNFASLGGEALGGIRPKGFLLLGLASSLNCAARWLDTGIEAREPMSARESGLSWPASIAPMNRALSEYGERDSLSGGHGRTMNKVALSRSQIPRDVNPPHNSENS